MILEMFENAEAYLSMVKGDIEKHIEEDYSEDEKLILENVDKAWKELLKEKEEIGLDRLNQIDKLEIKKLVSVIPYDSFKEDTDGTFICFGSFLLQIHSKDFRIYNDLAMNKVMIKVENGKTTYIKKEDR